MAATVTKFLQRNILVVLAIPPVVAGCFGIYAKFVRQPRPTTTTTAAGTAAETSDDIVIAACDAEQLKD